MIYFVTTGAKVESFFGNISHFNGKDLYLHDITIAEPIIIVVSAKLYAGSRKSTCSGGTVINAPNAGVDCVEAAAFIEDLPAR